MKAFENKTKILCGKGALDKLGYELDYFNCKAPLIICDEMTDKAGYARELKKKLRGMDITAKFLSLNIVDRGELSHLEKARKAFYEYSCDSIISLGGGGVTDIAKALKLFVNTGISNLSEINQVQSTDKTTLIVIPAFLGNGNEGTRFAKIYNTSHNDCYDIDSTAIAVNAVIIDESLSYTVSEKSLRESAIYALGMALCANVERISIFSKSYACAALSILHDNFLNKKRYSKSNKNAVMSAMIYAGIAFSEVEDNILIALTREIAEFKKVRRDIAFVCILPHYINMFINKFNKVNHTLLLLLVGDEEFSNVEEDKRNDALLNTIEKIYTAHNKLYGCSTKLRDYGVSVGDIDNIIEYTMQNCGQSLDGQMEYMLKEILNRAI